MDILREWVEELQTENKELKALNESLTKDN